MSTKYPNADTSPARLAHIEANIKFGPGNSYGYNENEITKSSVLGIIRDLLAMVQVRGMEIEIFAARMRDYQQQLHDQRWRKLSEEKPPFWTAKEAQNADHSRDIQVVFDNKAVGICRLYADGDTPERPSFMLDAYTDDEYDLHCGVIWWRPIPPLPTE